LLGNSLRNDLTWEFVTMYSNSSRNRRPGGWRFGGALILLALLIGATACGGDSDDTSTGGSGGGSLNLVAYSTPQAAYEQIGAAFKDSAAGKGVSISESYGSSGDQSRAVEGGQPADYVGFSLEPDMTRLVKAGLVADDWNKNQYNGMVTSSVVVFVVRDGNPKNIETWDDLIQPDLEVVTPNPFTSGGARWNVMAAYGANSDGGQDEAAGVDYLNQLFANVVVQDDSARKSLQTFTGGKGDVLLAYENEAIFAQQQGENIEYIVPEQTILIENPVAVTLNSENPEVAKAFLDFVYTPEAQEIFVENGYRPAIDGVPGADEFPEPSGLFTIAAFGGWSEVAAKFFDPKGSIMADVERSIGVSVES
jgi:sulfate transport system substrate-binding protein